VGTHEKLKKQTGRIERGGGGREDEAETILGGKHGASTLNR
jgi:hypothetical protein